MSVVKIKRTVQLQLLTKLQCGWADETTTRTTTMTNAICVPGKPELPEQHRERGKEIRMVKQSNRPREVSSENCRH